VTAADGWLTALERAVPEGAGEVAASLAVVVVVVAARRLARRALTRDEGLPGGSRARVALSGAVTVVTGLGVVVLVGIWGLLGPLVAAYEELGLSDVGGELVLTAVLLGSAYALIGFVGRLIDALASRRGSISEHQREVLYRLTQVSLWAVVGLVIVTLFTNDPSSLLVGAGFVGIVVGMAARQTLGAVLAGFVLMFSRPFEIGDWVEIGEKEGVVTGITVVNTRLQTFDGEHVMLPNDEVTSRSITNRTRKGRLRLEVEVGVDYGCDPDRAADVALAAVRGLDEILAVPTPQVVAKRFADSSVVLGVRVWIGDPSARRRWRARTAVVGAVHEAFDAEGIEIPFPQRSLTLREGAALAGAGTGGRRGPGAEPEVAPDGGDG
jgi:small-conductance mechanosensitive channel